MLGIIVKTEYWKRKKQIWHCSAGKRKKRNPNWGY